MGVPKENPAIENLNSYYLDFNKLIEHYQGEFGAGCIHFKSTETEGAIFFDQDDILNGMYSNGKTRTHGRSAVDALLRAAGTGNYAVDLYPIGVDEVYYWARIFDAEELYKNLSTEFTNLDALIKKMNSEKFTGYIDVTIDSGKDSSIIFFHNGNMVVGSYTWNKNGGLSTNLKILLEKTKAAGGVFHVGRFTRPKTSRKPIVEASVKPDFNVLEILEKLFYRLKSVLAADKRAKVPFDTLLKRKFIQKADRYAFLDPFTNEFNYTDGRITFVGTADAKQLVGGVVDSVREVSTEADADGRMTRELERWIEKHAKELAQLGIRL